MKIVNGFGKPPPGAGRAGRFRLLSQRRTGPPPGGRARSVPPGRIHGACSRASQRLPEPDRKSTARSPRRVGVALSTGPPSPGSESVSSAVMLAFTAGMMASPDGGFDHGLLKKNTREFLGLKNLRKSCGGRPSSGRRPVEGNFRVGMGGFWGNGPVIEKGRKKPPVPGARAARPNTGGWPMFLGSDIKKNKRLVGG